MIYKRRVDRPALFTKQKHMLINEHIQTRFLSTKSRMISCHLCKSV
uniref:Uncharacterized protein n=1 Tax=Anguilla anguilla TaxID=7936 RepID=A0A0E9UYI1_ANGAN